MKKKEYIKPAMQVIEIAATTILTGSTIDIVGSEDYANEDAY